MVGLSLVIPAFAEAAHLAGTLRSVHTFLVRQQRLETTEVIVVTADASDRTPEIARRELARFPIARHLEPGPKVGKGRDVRCGMLAARGEIVVFTDADLATPLGYIEHAITAIQHGSDVAIGRRDLARMHDRLSRRITSQLSNWLVGAVLLPGIADTQCGFKAFRRAIIPELFEPLETVGWGFDLEVLARARRAGGRITEIAVPDWADPKGDQGLAGEVHWVARLKTLGELGKLAWRFGRQPPSRRYIVTPPITATIR